MTGDKKYLKIETLERFFSDKTKKGALTHTANTPHNIMYEKKISYSQDEADEQSRLHATSPYRAFPEVPDSAFHGNQAENSCR